MKTIIIKALTALSFVLSSLVLNAHTQAAEDHKYDHQHEESGEHKKHHTDSDHEQHEDHDHDDHADEHVNKKTKENK